MKKNIKSLEKIKSYYLKLLQSDHNILLHSFSHLYFKNSHPNFIESTDIFKKKNFHILSVIKYFLNKFFLTYRIKQNVNKMKKEMIILSHKLKITKNKDMYFESLKKKLKKKYITVYINHTSIPSKKLELEKNSIILSTKLNFFKEFYLTLKLIVYSINNFKIFKYHKKLHSKLKLIKQSHYNLRIYIQLKKILIKNKPKTILFTYEGYAYERLICKLSKDLDIKSCGYQTSVIIPSSYSIFQNYLEEYNPNIIFTPNKYYENIFKKRSKLKKTKIICIGAMQSIPQVNYNKFPRNDNILVLPEGIPSECLNLFRFSYKLAVKNSNLNFIWRIHPVLRWNEIIKSLAITNLPKNIRLSKINLYNDIKKSKFCLYRGSGAAVEAIRNNILPIYLKKENEIESIDPLFQYNKNVIKNEKDFLELFNKYKNRKIYTNELNKFKNFLDTFYQKKKINNLKYF